VCLLRAHQCGTDQCGTEGARGFIHNRAHNRAHRTQLYLDKLMDRLGVVPGVALATASVSVVAAGLTWLVTNFELKRRTAKGAAGGDGGDGGDAAGAGPGVGAVAFDGDVAGSSDAMVETVVETVVETAAETAAEIEAETETETEAETEIEDDEEYDDDEYGSEYAEEHKMVLVVNASLKMKPGKVAAQCVHAALGAAREAPEAIVHEWEDGGEKVVVFRAVDESVLAETVAKAEAAEVELTVFQFEDAGRTQVAAGSTTVIAFGPAPESWFDGVTNTLPLYR